MANGSAEKTEADAGLDGEHGRMRGVGEAQVSCGITWDTESQLHHKGTFCVTQGSIRYGWVQVLLGCCEHSASSVLGSSGLWATSVKLDGLCHMLFRSQEGRGVGCGARPCISSDRPEGLGPSVREFKAMALGPLVLGRLPSAEALPTVSSWASAPQLAQQTWVSPGWGEMVSAMEVLARAKPAAPDLPEERASFVCCEELTSSLLNVRIS
ncbi:hypothetical protein J1605_002293 [Eschrichtius robustus]|uniref:Uncharacterized protein n=1 Tax=Eschrichtius robustus TaxID=9764 RepID=A0AB34HX23_ESCRO|nr:hypothetical protein J1605_002293 [Eschrichtius robustus]